MNLFIENSSNYNMDAFISGFLIDLIKKFFISKIDSARLIPIEEFLNSKVELQQFGHLKPIRVDLKSILIGSIENLKWTKSSTGDYNIEVDPNQMVPNLQAKFIDIARLVNYGSLSTPAYPIYDDTFEYFADNLGNLIDKYLGGI